MYSPIQQKVTTILRCTDGNVVADSDSGGLLFDA